MGTVTEHEERFRLIYAGNFEPVLAYALRRVDQPADAADVVAEIFLVAWRRHREIPAGDEARLWLYRVSRRVLANHYRGGARRERLAQRLRQRLTELTADPGSYVPRQLAVRQAVAKLGALDREVLLLTAWEGLEPREVAQVLDVSAAAVRTRLSRARARLRDLLGDDPARAGHDLDVLTNRAPEEGR